MAATRPLIWAEPMLRAPRPEMVSESTLTGPDAWGFAGCGVCAAAQAASARTRNDDENQRVSFVFISRESFFKGVGQGTEPRAVASGYVIREAGPTRSA